MTEPRHYVPDQTVWLKQGDEPDDWVIAKVESVLPAPQNVSSKKRGGGTGFDGRLNISVTYRTLTAEVTIVLDKPALDAMQDEFAAYMLDSLD